MPIIKSAKKQLRQDKRRALENVKTREEYKKALRTIKKAADEKKKIAGESVKAAYSTLDKAAKKNVIHTNKASRLKSRVSKLVQQSK